MVTKPNTSDANTPTAMPTHTARGSEPPLATVMKLAKAPNNIMPSSPRLSTPARSAINSPNAANRKGMAAPKALANKGVNDSVTREPPQFWD